jgi:hypothetical protein
MSMVEGRVVAVAITPMQIGSPCLDRRIREFRDVWNSWWANLYTFCTHIPVKYRFYRFCGYLESTSCVLSVPQYSSTPAASTTLTRTYKHSSSS